MPSGASGAGRSNAQPAPQGRPGTGSRPAQAGPPFERPAGPDDTPEDLRSRARSCGNLDALAHEVAYCQACALGRTRTRSVFADGRGEKGVMFVGEAPGYHEDQQGRPFVGDAGKLLSDIISKGMGLERARDVFICNVLKCRPPGNRDPEPAEKERCTAWLDRQIELVRPKVVIALGRHAAGHLLGRDESLGRLRGQVRDRDGTPVVVTYHPAYLLRSPEQKKECWRDIQLAMGVVGLEPRSGR